MSGPADQGLRSPASSGMSTPPLRQGEDVGPDARGRWLLLALHIRGVELVVDLARSGVISRLLAFPDRQVVTHGRSLPAVSDDPLRPRGWFEGRAVAAPMA